MQVGDVDADNNDGCEDMQMRFYCACARFSPYLLP